MTIDFAASLSARSRTALLLVALSLPLAACSSPGVAATSAPAATAASAAPATSASPTTAASSASPSASATSAKPTPTASGYTMAEVRKHADAKSCWSVVDGNVYDLTRWVTRHPGGRARILSMCGKDGSATFHGEHRKEAQPLTTLAGYKLGKLA